MHSFFLTRGIWASREQWKTQMQSQWFNWKRQRLLRDEHGNLIPDGVDENGSPKYKRVVYLKDIKDKKTGKLLHKEGDPVYEYTRVQGALRPIELWEYIHPRESLQEVLAMQNIHKAYNNPTNIDKILWVLRRGLQATKIPDMPDLKNKESHEVTQKLVYTGGFAVCPIGIREDPYKDYDFKKEGAWRQEGL